MAKKTPEQQQKVKAIRTAYFNAFGKPASEDFVSFWMNRPLESLGTALQNDTRAGGVFADRRNQVQGGPAGQAPVDQPTSQPAPLSTEDVVAKVYRELLGREPDQAGLDAWKQWVDQSGHSEQDLRNAIQQSAEFRQKNGGMLTYDEFLNGPGQSYANSYSDATLNSEYDPYYQQQVGSLENEKNLAKQDLAKSTYNTTQNTNQNFNERGIYGSGVYQDSLNRELTDLSQTYDRNYGIGQYTSYSQRKRDILENQRVAKESARLQRQGQAQSAYLTQYAPLFNQ